MEKHVLVILPHPDDETLAMGGTIILQSRAGTPVTYVCGTLGEMGRNMGKPFFASRESLPRLREAELREACAVLGVSDIRLLGIRDKTVEFVDRDQLVNRLMAMIEEIRPSLVLTYHPLFSVHPDHMAMGAATVEAVGRIPADRRPPVHYRAFGPGVEVLGPPDYVVDATEVLEAKMKAIGAHRSQTEGMLERMASDPEARKRMEEMRSKESYWIHKYE